MNKIIILILVVIFLFNPSLSHASGGGPLLLLFSLSVFIIGQIWIIFIEFIIYNYYTSIPHRKSIKDVIIVNLFSTIIFGFIFPILISSLGLLAGLFQSLKSDFISAMFTWAWDGMQYGRLAIYSSFIWFFLLAVMTIFFEAWFFKIRWRKKEYKIGLNPLKLSWKMNVVSFAGLFAGILIIWRDLLI